MTGRNTRLPIILSWSIFPPILRLRRRPITPLTVARSTPHTAATEAVVRALPDGHTLLLVGTGAAINASFYERLSFNLIRDIAPVAGINRISLAMAINPSLPAKTIPEFIAYAEGNPGKNVALADPIMKTRLAELGGIAMPTTPAEFGKLMSEEPEKGAKVVRAAKIKPQ
jgi:hypothetical protein